MLRLRTVWCHNMATSPNGQTWRNVAKKTSVHFLIIIPRYWQVVAYVPLLPISEMGEVKLPVNVFCSVVCEKEGVAKEMPPVLYIIAYWCNRGGFFALGMWKLAKVECCCKELLFLWRIHSSMRFGMSWPSYDGRCLRKKVLGILDFTVPDPLFSRGDKSLPGGAEASPPCSQSSKACIYMAGVKCNIKCVDCFCLAWSAMQKELW